MSSNELSLFQIKSALCLHSDYPHLNKGRTPGDSNNLPVDQNFSYRFEHLLGEIMINKRSFKGQVTGRIEAVAVILRRLH
jgi:hypothetical protein